MVKKLFSAILALILLLGGMPRGSAFLPPDSWEDDYQYPVEGGVLYFDKEKTVLRHAPLGFSGTYTVADGVSETHFAPKAPCTRGQIVTFLCRAMAYNP